MASPTQSEDSSSLSFYLRALYLRRWLILTIVALTLITAIIVTWAMPQWYRATVVIKVDKPEEQVALFSREGSGYDPFFSQEQVEILTSKQILYQVIEALDLQQKLGDMFADGQKLSPGQAYMFLAERVPLSKGPPLARRMISVRSTQQGTSLIEISAWTLGDPQLAAAIANAIAVIYSEDRIAFATANQTEGIARLREELEKQGRIVSDQRDAVENLRSELSISGVDLDMAVLNQDVENLRSIERSLIQLRVEAIGRKSRWENFKAIPEEDRLSLVNSELITDVNLQDLLQAYMLQQQQYAKLAAQLGDEHPELKASRRSIETIREQLDNLLNGYQRSLELSYLEAKARMEELQRQLGEMRSAQIDSETSRMRPFEDSVEKLREEERIYQTMKLTLRQREIDFQAPKKSIEILSQAEAPVQSAWPNWFLNIFLALLCGSVLGISVALIVDLCDTSFRGVEEIEKLTGLPALGIIPRGLHLINASSYETTQAEPYRVLQTNLELVSDPSKSRVLALQSAGPGEGKSTTLRNLAAVMALSGQKVLIIDTDLRRPVQHRHAKLSVGPGLANVLDGGMALDEAIRPTDVAGLDLLTSGETGRALNRIAVKKLEAELHHLRQRYDVIFLDSPPVLGLSDAGLIAGLVDTVVLVVQHRRHPRRMILRAKQTIDTHANELAGLVLNRVPLSAEGDYQYYHANYAYYRGQDKARMIKSPKSDMADEESAEGIRLKE
ncbi:GumC family protein [Cerasicoccus arenae]|uniref:non-specific protein-tyrosine kinase n=1 Tax=Cerasicoccus arenae TaxID=424488 RepID=A0A8J3GDB8_9BACT|nr:polysaccharide biosynthesis tyrosine autokinase [Cerasicoccus arenae]MBK1857524.1 polysaccharide biosynthesis tyrosine autokinase [Cerasicoccus arenae]GHB95505.1 chain-length determining protein [Cerasicoccus arenae]